MGLKEYLESKKQSIKLKRTIVEVDTGDTVYSDKFKTYSIVYMTDRKTGTPEFSLCGLESEFLGFIPVIVTAANTTNIIQQPRYRHFYVDLLNSRKPLNDKKYKIGDAYYLTYLFSIEYLESKNYCLTRDEIEAVFEQAKKEIIEKEKDSK